jgi:hypothetical protein
MTTPSILAAVIIGALFAIAGAAWLIARVKLRRMRALACPNCHTEFNVPSFWAIRRWSAFDLARFNSYGSGFYLRCERCAVDYRISCSCQILGRAGQTA